MITDSRHVYQNNAKHCSRECKLEAKRRRWAASYKPRKIQVKTCVTCGKSFEAKRAQRKYCSDECYTLAGILRKRVKRKKQPKKKELKNLSEAVFRGLCSVCGVDGVPVVECSECGYLSCRKCINDSGICKICSGMLVASSTSRVPARC